MFRTPFRFWVQIFIGFAAWNNLTGSAQAQVLSIPAANDGGINSPNRLNKHPFRCEATETFRASLSRLTAAPNRQTHQHRQALKAAGMAYATSVGMEALKPSTCFKHRSVFECRFSSDSPRGTASLVLRKRKCWQSRQQMAEASTHPTG
ncbi:hypothetical protein MRX96_017483 [Rhipicephalus microplus]